MKYLCSLLLLIISNCVYGQKNIPVDSLMSVINNQKAADTSKIGAYTGLVYHYMYDNKDSTLYYSNKLFKFSKSKHSDYGMYYAHYSKAFYFYTSSSFDSVTHHLEKAVFYGEKSNNLKLVSDAHSKLSGVYSMLNEKEKAIEHAEKALKAAIKNKDWTGVGEANLVIGNIHFYNNEFDLAILHYQKVDSILSIHKPLDISLGNALSNIGLIFMNQNQDDKAEAYFKRTETLFTKMEYTHGLQVVKARMGKLEVNQGKYKQAIDKLSSSLTYFEEIGDDFKVAENNYQLGIAYFEVNNRVGAFQSLDKALELKKKINDSLGVLETLVATSKLRFKNNEPEESLTIATEALTLSKKLSSLAIERDALLIIAQDNALLNNFEQSYLYYQEYNIINDSLLKVQNLEKVQELETKYQTEKNEQEIVLLKSQNELAEQQKKSQRSLLLGGIGITSLVGMFFFLLYRNRQKTNNKLKELDTVKSNFFANISHEFRTPLTLISGPLEKKLENEKLNKEDRDEFEMMQRNSKRLLNLVNQLLDLSRLESGNLGLHVKEGDISLLLRSLTVSFNHKSTTQKLEYIINIQEPMNGWFDRDAVEKITINLLSNAFKYVSEKGKISFTSTIKDEKLELLIENDGEISGDTKIEKIFNRFYQKDDSKDGVGIGLALVKELVLLHKGTINVMNTNHRSVLFSVILPIAQNQFSEEERTAKTIESTPFITFEDSVKAIENDSLTEEINEDSPILLIVEDSEDIRLFIKNAFKNQYQVIEAKDGKEGIEKALELIPDIIISDIMMPKVNGLELCEVLKKDEKTSHIPIVLLTAKTAEKTQFEGLETGADDYIVKPFKLKLLEARVKNLVASRKQLRDRYSQEVILKPMDISISSIDQKFIERTQAVLDENLTDPDLNIEDFSKHVGMSRMQLHRKLKAITGLTATEFIRTQRLRLAASLLEKSDVNVSEICYQVGFNNPSYFSKCFKDEFGCLPSEYAQK